MEDSRGFEMFVGRTVVSVDSSSINVVHFTLDNGDVVSVDAENHVMNIPMVSASRGYWDR